MHAGIRPRRGRSPHGIGLLLLALTSLVPFAWGQSPAANDEAAVRQAGKAFIQAIHEGNAEAACALWTAEGRYIDAAGQSHPARDFIREHVGKGPSAAKAEIESELAASHQPSIRFVAPTVALEEGAMLRQPKAGATVQASSYSAVWVKEGDRWLLGSVHESLVPPVHPLESLEWMIGEWQATDQDVVVHCKSHWTKSRAFIVRQFQIEKSGGLIVDGTQWIGWDPAAGTIRSWAFDSDGGISEGIWRQEKDANAWIVKNSGILPDGSHSSSVHFWISEGYDRFVVKHSHVEVNEKSMEDVVLEFHRVGS